MKPILVGIPTLNGAKNIEPMVARLGKLPLPLELLFVDDNSSDGSAEILDRIAQENSAVRVVHRTGKAGIGSAHQAILEYAYDGRYETLITMDCDFSHQPEDLPRLLEESSQKPVVVGSRFMGIKDDVGDMDGVFLPKKMASLHASQFTAPIGAKRSHRGLFVLGALGGKSEDMGGGGVEDAALREMFPHKIQNSYPTLKMNPEALNPFIRRFICRILAGTMLGCQIVNAVWLFTPQNIVPIRVTQRVPGPSPLDGQHILPLGVDLPRKNTPILPCYPKNGRFHQAVTISISGMGKIMRPPCAR